MNRTSMIAVALIGLLAMSLAACGMQPSSAEPAVAHAAAAPTAQATATPRPPATEPTTLPAAARTRTISGIGEIKALRDVGLVFTVPGIVAEVPAKEGDVVKKGQLLAILDTRPFDQQVDQTAAALNVAKAQEAALTDSAPAADVKAADALVRQAQIALKQARTDQTQDIRTAQATVAAAQASLQAIRDGLSTAKTQAESQVDQATLALTQAQAHYAQAKNNYEYARATGKDPLLPKLKGGAINPLNGKKISMEAGENMEGSYYELYVQAEAAMHQAEEAVQQARVAAAHAHQAEVTGIQTAEQQVVQAQAALDKLQVPANQDRVAAAQAALAAAQANRARLNPDPRPSAKDAAKSNVAAAAAALAQAKLNREYAELRAPFDAVVAEVTIDPGDASITLNRSAITLVDVSTLRVEVDISDADIALVNLDQKAEVRVDALPEQMFRGKVSYIAPSATVRGNVRTYVVRVTLDKQQRLRPGMNVRVDLPTDAQL